MDDPKFYTAKELIQRTAALMKREAERSRLAMRLLALSIPEDAPTDRMARLTAMAEAQCKEYDIAAEELEAAYGRAAGASTSGDK